MVQDPAGDRVCLFPCGDLPAAARSRSEARIAGRNARQSCQGAGPRTAAPSSTSITSATFDEVAHSVTLSGLGTNNGLPVAFTIVAVDSSLVPPGLFSITLSNGYNNSGNLLDGSITVY